MLMLTSLILLIGCKTSYETITYVELRDGNMLKDTIVIDSRYAHNIEYIRRCLGVKENKWVIDKVEVYNKDSHLKNNEKQGRYPKPYKFN